MMSSDETEVLSCIFFFTEMELDFSEGAIFKFINLHGFEFVLNRSVLIYTSVLEIHISFLLIKSNLCQGTYLCPANSENFAWIKTTSAKFPRTLALFFRTAISLKL